MAGGDSDSVAAATPATTNAAGSHTPNPAASPTPPRRQAHAGGADGGSEHGLGGERQEAVVAGDGKQGGDGTREGGMQVCIGSGTRQRAQRCGCGGVWRHPHRRL